MDANERAEQARILTFLKEKTAPGEEADEGLDVIRRNLTTGRRSPQTAPDDEIVRALLPPTRPATHEDWSAARIFARNWRATGLTPDEVREWLRAGIEPSEGALAWLLDSEGLTPSRAFTQFEHPTTGEQTTPAEVVRRTPQSWEGRSYTDRICDALDQAQIERDRMSRRTRRPTA